MHLNYTSVYGCIAVTNVDRIRTSTFVSVISFVSIDLASRTIWTQSQPASRHEGLVFAVRLTELAELEDRWACAPLDTLRNCNHMSIMGCIEFIAHCENLQFTANVASPEHWNVVRIVMRIALELCATAELITLNGTLANTFIEFALEVELLAGLAFLALRHFEDIIHHVEAPHFGHHLLLEGFSDNAERKSIPWLASTDLNFVCNVGTQTRSHFFLPKNMDMDSGKQDIRQ